MPSIINASVTSNGIVQTADASGVLQLQSNGTTGLTVGSGGVLTAANGIVMSPMTLGSAVTGEFEYDGSVPYFTPLGTQRGIIPGMQYYRLNSAVVGANVTTPQSVYGVGVTLSSNTVYAFQGYYAIAKSAGTTQHTTSSSFGGTATLNSIGYLLTGSTSSVSFTARVNAATNCLWITTAAATSYDAGAANAAFFIMTRFEGTVSVANGGTFIPQYTLGTAPGGAYTTQIGSYFMIYPIGAAGSNTSVGTWA